jgi:NAD+ synthase
MIKTYSDLQDRMVVNPNKVIQGINNHLINLQNKLKKDGVLIGLSGGIYSTVVTVLCTKALGNDKVKVLLLPDNESIRVNLLDAQDFAKQDYSKRTHS